ncbi:MAG: hypothetical protein N2317_08410 [Syntrophales bacterium]|nr:hypothetical protein [Syntrophales bacterium]
MENKAGFTGRLALLAPGPSAPSIGYVPGHYRLLDPVMPVVWILSKLLRLSSANYD